jgi:acetylornithine/N-succinyldiaminopimelate aminotransferase
MRCIFTKTWFIPHPSPLIAVHLHMDLRQLFLRHVAQTSPSPAGLEITAARGSYLYGADGKSYMDLIGGISVCNVGHCHPAVVAAIKHQAEQYLHVMVYGETIQSPQVQYAHALTERLPAPLDCVYFTNSGAEATEGALKLARRVTGRTDIISCNRSYHGNTLGALSVMGDEYWRSAFRPLLPGVRRYDYNGRQLIDAIDEQTACVIIETIQAEAGVICPDAAWLRALRAKCSETGALLIMDEIQCGFGRTGTTWGFEHYGIVPDIVLLGKALGGGMPLGAFVAAQGHMQALTANPVLGHLTTFGGHPVSCAAGLAALQVLADEALIPAVAAKEQLFLQLLKHPGIREIRSKGLLIAVELQEEAQVSVTLQRCLQQGVFSDWFLFAPGCIRIAPPLTISEAEIEKGCAVLLDCL